MNHPINRRSFQTVVAAGAAALAFPAARAAGGMALFDAHVHYSHDAWELVPPKQAVQILRKAGLRARARVVAPTTKARSGWSPRRRT